MKAFVAGLIVLAAPVQAETYHFCWLGSGGYTLTGQMTVGQAFLRSLVTESEVSAFRVTGYLDGQPIGSWNMADRTPDTTWHLRFDPLSMSFLVGGSFPGVASQGWNADGDVSDCGAGGFGFNSGNYSQDLCLNGKWIEASMIHPATPFLVGTEPVTPDCKVVAPLS